MKVLFHVEGKMSTFGGKDDKGMSATEGLSLFSSEQDMINHGLSDYLVSETAAGAPGLGRRLDPAKPYIACRWWETNLTKDFLKATFAWVENVSTGQRVRARPVDSGPHDRTGRVADLSPGLAKSLGLETDDICSVTISTEGSEFSANVQHAPADMDMPKIYSTEEWGAQPAKVSYFPVHGAVGIIVHNTEGNNRVAFDDPEKERNAAFDNARQIQHSHMFERKNKDGTIGWSDTGQHFTISQGGVITEGRHGTLSAAKAGNVVRGAHCPGKNDDWWGIELAGDNQKNLVVTPQQEEALVKLCRWLRTVAGKSLPIQPHNHFESTTCPGKIVAMIPELVKEIEA